MTYQERKFELPQLIDLAPEPIAAHLALYAGYVKNFNAITVALADLMQDSEKNAHALSELERRLPFEWNGMCLHEYYFSQWESAPAPLNAGGALASSLAGQYGSAEQWERQLRAVASMRGVGWALLYFDPQAGVFHNVWVEQHHQGHYATLPLILALDVWEHAYVQQYGTAGRGAYMDAFFKNLNWSVMEERFSKTSAV